MASIGTGRIPPRKIEAVDLAMPSNLELSLNAILNVKKAVEAIWNLKNMLIEQVFLKFFNLYGNFLGSMFRWTSGGTCDFLDAFAKSSIFPIYATTSFRNSIRRKRR